MNELLKSKKIKPGTDLTGLRKFFENIESHLRSLQGLFIESKNYGLLLASIILETPSLAEIWRVKYGIWIIFYCLLMRN